MPDEEPTREPDGRGGGSKGIGLAIAGMIVTFCVAMPFYARALYVFVTIYAIVRAIGPGAGENPVTIIVGFVLITSMFAIMLGVAIHFVGRSITPKKRRGKPDSGRSTPRVDRCVCARGARAIGSQGMTQPTVDACDRRPWYWRYTHHPTQEPAHAGVELIGSGRDAASGERDAQLARTCTRSSEPTSVASQAWRHSSAMGRRLPLVPHREPLDLVRPYDARRGARTSRTRARSDGWSSCGCRATSTGSTC